MGNSTRGISEAGASNSQGATGQGSVKNWQTALILAPEFKTTIYTLGAWG
jgi:hypothetical protein